jgi:hypothetical protein
MDNYNGYKYSTIETETGFLIEGADEGGAVVFGFGVTEDEAISDMKRRIDEYDFFFSDLSI